MYEVEQTSVYAVWFRKIRDPIVRGRIVARIERVQLGNLGDVKSIGDGVHELRLTFGAGYRLYFTYVGTRVILLLCGGNKSGQSRDVAQAKQIVSELE